MGLVCNTGGGYTLYGATSWGKSCRGITIYAGVYSAMSWIRSYVGNGPGPSPSPSPTPPAPTPAGGACQHQKDCAVNPWCRDTAFEAWCRQQGEMGVCPEPYCTRAQVETSSLAGCTGSDYMHIDGLGVDNFADQMWRCALS